MIKKIIFTPDQASKRCRDEIQAKICPVCGRRDSRITNRTEANLFQRDAVHYQCRNFDCRTEWRVEF